MGRSGLCRRIRGRKNDKRNNLRALKNLCRKAGVPERSWHPLRHTYGSMLAAKGVDYRTIGVLMGHAPGSTVTLRYLHTDAERLRAAVEKLG